jgi:NAD-dependent deacetylase
MERIFEDLHRCTMFVAIWTSGAVEPAASFVALVSGRARTVYVGPEEPANRAAFTEVCLGKAGELLPELFAVDGKAL